MAAEGPLVVSSSFFCDHQLSVWGTKGPKYHKTEFLSELVTSFLVDSKTRFSVYSVTADLLRLISWLSGNNKIVISKTFIYSDASSRRLMTRKSMVLPPRTG